MNHRKLIYITLVNLVLLDLVLSIVGFFFPDTWSSFFHQTIYPDDQALLKRCAANWFAFFALQSVALFRWERATWWLVLIAGCRLGDALTDVTCMAFASSISAYGIIGFTAAGLGNIIIGVYFVKQYLRMNKSL